MLAYILALIVGSGGFALYMAAFFFPEVHRKNDFLWSGVGLFYALVLWVCAERITGGLLLGQTASVALLGWLGWQTFLLRRQVAPLDQQTPLPTVDEVKASFTGLTRAEGRSGAAGQASRLLNQVKQGVQGAVSGIPSLRRSPAESEIYVPPSLEEFGTAGQDAIARFAKVAIPEPETVTSALSEVEDAIRETAAKASKISTGVANEAEQITIENLADAAEVAREAAAMVVESAQTMKNAIAPIPKQVTEQVAEEVAETTAEKGKGLGGLFQGLNQKPPKKESKPVYVRKQFREEAATPLVKTGKKPSPKENPRKDSKPTSKPVYVRKQFREDIDPEPKEIVKEAIAEVKEAIAEINEAEVKAPVISSTDLPAAIASTSETISEAVVSELLGNAPVETSAAEIVEDLLEDISAQEGTLVIEATEIIEVAIESNDGLMEPLTWVVELENDPVNDTAIEPSSPTRAVDNSEHLH